MSNTTYTAPFSFIGSTKRITGYFGYRNGRDWGSPARRFTLGVLLMLAFILTLVLAWSAVLTWYSFLGVFFWIAIPWRIIRRNQRRNRHLQEQQLAALREANSRPLSAHELDVIRSLGNGMTGEVSTGSKSVAEAPVPLDPEHRTH